MLTLPYEETIESTSHTHGGAYRVSTMPEDLAKSFKAHGIDCVAFINCAQSGVDRWRENNVSWNVQLTDEDGNVTGNTITFDYINTGKNIRIQQLEKILGWLDSDRFLRNLTEAAA